MNQPPLNQCRTAVYLAVIHGAQGIFWFNAHMGDWRLPQTPMWESFAGLNRETDHLGQIVLQGRASDTVRVLPEEGPVHTAVWRKEHRVYVLLANPTDEPTEVELLSDEDVAGDVSAYSGRAVSANGNTLRLRLDAMDADVVEFRIGDTP